MQFDDRLATVLRQRAHGRRARDTQFRQLVDLMRLIDPLPDHDLSPDAGSRIDGADDGARAERPGRASSLDDAAWHRLAELSQSLAVPQRAAILREPGMTLRNRAIVEHFAVQDDEVAVAALGAADLPESEWELLIARMPVQTRGVLRTRRDLPARARAMLERLGIHDRALPPPPPLSAPAASPPQAETPPPAPGEPPEPAPTTARNEIGELVQRIENFRRAREQRGQVRMAADRLHPRLPLGEAEVEGGDRLGPFSFTTDADFALDWADDRAAPMVLHAALPGLLGNADRQRLYRHQALAGVSLALPGAPPLGGAWILDASPAFSRKTGQFLGYAGRFRRPFEGRSGPRESDRLRQLLHELRTPVNAIQGYAEALQQQIFGAVPHEYRAHAAAIAGDGARILAGFEDLDRLAKLETGARELDPGTASLSAIVAGQCDRLADVLDARDCGFVLDLAGDLLVPLDAAEGERLIWRLLAAVAATLLPGQRARITLERRGPLACLRAQLPGAQADAARLFKTSLATHGGPVSVGPFGTGFAMRLARAEAESIGGTLIPHGPDLLLTLPMTPGHYRDISKDSRKGSSARP